MSSDGEVALSDDGRRHEKPAIDDDRLRGALFAPTTVRRVYAVAMVVASLLLVVSVAHPWGWTVDTTTLGLLGLACALPIIDRLQRLKFGGVEMELREMSQKLERLEFENAATSSELAERADVEGTADELDDELALEASPNGARPLEPIDRIVWVDDDPNTNEPYAAQLRRRFDVVIATSTAQGLEHIDRAPDRTLVITDAVRDEGGRTNYDAGLQLLEELRARHPYTPALVFAGTDTVQAYRPRFEDAGAAAATSTFVELAEQVRSIGQRRFRAAVGALVRQAAGRPSGEGSSSWLLEQDGRRIRIEARDWRRRPTSTAIQRVMTRARKLLDNGDVDQVIVVVPRNQVTPQQHHQAPDDVDIVEFHALRQRLGLVTA